MQAGSVLCKNWKGWLTSLCASLMLALPIHAEEVGNTDKSRKDSERNVDKTKYDAKSLVNALENRNRAPKLVNNVDETLPLFDEKYDWKEYKRVSKAIHFLLDHAEDAWPELVRHLDDERYCMTYDSFGFAGNLSVGEICRWIIEYWLHAPYFNSQMVPHFELVWRKLDGYPGTLRKEQLKRWCEKRSHKKLYELQIEACEWVLRIIPTLDDLEEQERIVFRKAIEHRIEELRKSQKPVHASQFGKERATGYDALQAEKIRSRVQSREKKG